MWKYSRIRSRGDNIITDDDRDIPFCEEKIWLSLILSSQGHIYCKICLQWMLPLSHGHAHELEYYLLSSKKVYWCNHESFHSLKHLHQSLRTETSQYSNSLFSTCISSLWYSWYRSNNKVPAKSYIRIVRSAWNRRWKGGWSQEYLWGI